MGNRKQPFGYRMTLGEITIQPEEAETVRSIYLQYIAGASFKQLAEQLQAEDVLYMLLPAGKLLRKKGGEFIHAWCLLQKIGYEFYHNSPRRARSIVSC